MEQALNDIERLALIGIQARQQQIQIDQLSLCRAIEERLRLPIGAIGTTHQIDGASWQVITVREPMP